MKLAPKQSRKGFALLDIAIVLAIIGVIATAGAYIYFQQRPDSTTKKGNSTSATASTAAPAAPEIQTASDLDNATKILDQTNVDASDAEMQQLNSDLANL